MDPEDCVLRGTAPCSVGLDGFDQGDEVPSWRPEEELAEEEGENKSNTEPALPELLAVLADYLNELEDFEGGIVAEQPKKQTFVRLSEQAMTSHVLGEEAIGKAVCNGCGKGCQFNCMAKLGGQIMAMRERHRNPVGAGKGDIDVRRKAECFEMLKKNMIEDGTKFKGVRCLTSSVPCHCC